MQFRGVVFSPFGWTKGKRHKHELTKFYPKLELRRALLIYIYIYNYMGNGPVRTVLTQVYKDSSTPTKRTSHPTILSAHIKGTAGNEKKKKRGSRFRWKKKKKPEG